MRLVLTVLLLLLANRGLASAGARDEMALALVAQLDAHPARATLPTMWTPASTSTHARSTAATTGERGVGQAEPETTGLAHQAQAATAAAAGQAQAQAAKTRTIHPHQAR
jgi:septal ring-binding cell division protein DamX